MADMQKLAIEALQAIANGEGEHSFVAAQALAEMVRDGVEKDLETALLAMSTADSDDVAFFDTFADIRDRWRARRGDAGKGNWRWWAGELDGEAYANEFATRDDAIAWGRAEWPGTPFRIIEACLWEDEFDPIDEVMPFADTRNAETING